MCTTNVHHKCAPLMCTTYVHHLCAPPIILTCVWWQTGLSKYTRMIAPLPLDILLLVLSFCSGDNMNILPPLSVVDHAIYQSSHTNRKRISALKHPPINISRPSLVENLRLHRDFIVSFVHACESGVSLHNLRSLRLRGSIGDAEMVDLSRAIATDPLAIERDNSIIPASPI